MDLTEAICNKQHVIKKVYMFFIIVVILSSLKAVKYLY